MAYSEPPAGPGPEGSLEAEEIRDSRQARHAQSEFSFFPNPYSMKQRGAAIKLQLGRLVCTAQPSVEILSCLKPGFTRVFAIHRDGTSVAKLISAFEKRREQGVILSEGVEEMNKGILRIVFALSL